MTPGVPYRAVSPRRRSVRQDPADYGICEQPSLKGKNQSSLECLNRINQFVSNEARHRVAPDRIQGIYGKSRSEPRLQHDPLDFPGAGVEGFAPCGR